MKLTEILVTLSLYVPLIVVFAICIALEIFLANRQSRWPGLIMPIISFALSLLLVFGFVAFSAVSATSELQVTDAETGEIIHQEQRVEEVSDWTLGDTVQLGILLLVGNIPTFVLLGTYYIGREKLRRDKLLEKMHIQDL